MSAKMMKPSAIKQPPTSKSPRRPWWKLAVLGVIVLALIVVGVAAGPHVADWLQHKPKDQEQPEEASASVRLIKDAQGRPGLEVATDALEGLNVRTAPVRKPASRALPVLIGQTTWDIEKMYPVRPIANGRVIAIEKVPEVPQGGGKTGERPIGINDRVQKGQLLAVVRSPDLADKKGAYVDALLTLYVDNEKLTALEGPYRRGSIPEATYRDARAQVEKDINAAARARRALELVPLKPREIQDLEKETQEIRQHFKELAKNAAITKEVHADSEYRARVERWARIEVTAPAAGTIVEMNTNVGDIADPGNTTPMFRLANLNTLAVSIHVPEEYVRLLQKILEGGAAEEATMEIRLEAEPHARPLQGKLVRFGSSVDPNQHTALLIGQVANPGQKLLVGQLLKVTIRVPAEPDLVEIPMTALNEVGGQSLVMVQDRGPSGDQPKPRFFLRRVQVVNRFATTVQVRSRPRLNPGEEKRLAEEVRRGLRPIEGLHVGEWVVTNGVVELTDALQDKQAEAQAKESQASK